MGDTFLVKNMEYAASTCNIARTRSIISCNVCRERESGSIVDAIVF